MTGGIFSSYKLSVSTIRLSKKKTQYFKCSVGEITVLGAMTTFVYSYVQLITQPNCT